MTMDQDKAPAQQGDTTPPIDAPPIDAPPSEAPPIETPPTEKKRGGRFLASLSLLVALAAIGAAGYLYYELLYLKPLAALGDRVGGIESALPTLKSDLGDLRQAQIDSLETLAAEQRESLAEAQQSMISALNEVSSQGPPAPREWKLAEVEYLLRIANHRVLMERDVDAALKLLGTADAILLELDDFGLYQVRAVLADEILALSGVRGNDVQGIYLRLEAIKGGLLDLPLDLPEYLSRGEVPAAEAATNFWEALQAELSSYLALRRFDGSTKPLLAPEEAVYLELNLRLMLERSQLAALRRQQIVYEQSIATARDWLGEYLDSDDHAVAQVVAELDSLLEIQLDQQLPDISGSLTALLQVRRGGG
jgi:uroporphyrin-3 C-methyltransferase